MHVTANGYGTVAVVGPGNILTLLDEDRVVIIRSANDHELVYDMVISAWESTDANLKTDPPSVTKTYEVGLHSGAT